MRYFLTVNYNSASLIERLLASLPAENSCLIIVNNSPEDKQIQQLQGDRVKLIESKANLGFGKACNLGLQWVYRNDPTAIVWLINPDAYLLPDSVVNAERFFADCPEVSIAGTEIYEPDGKIWFGWGKFNPKIGTINVVEESLDYGDKPYRVPDWVTGCSLLINLARFSSCPAFDDDYFLYYEDFDLSRRYANQGHLVVVTNRIKIIHEPSSITLRYGYLRLTHNIYSYLLSLEKHTNSRILYYRFFRMILMAVLILPFRPKFSLAKLEGLKMYSSRILDKLRSPIDPENVKNFS
ncbi:glycosyltransferase [Pannus brasiliensis CCIBt3594]|uniref:Glycosyltransferase n=1 Tax=Pannus brasiliensis CCIBt3594 TaxID=1427578 RepID=A0AAW9QY91_9CHRO